MGIKFYTVCFVACLSLSVKAFSQTGTYYNSVLTEKPNTPIDSMINGYIEVLPSGYDPNSSTTYPLLIFFEGISQLGNGGTELTKLYGQNEGMLPDIIRKGLLPGDTKGYNSFTVSGTTYHFIMLIPQVRPQIKNTTTDWVATPGEVNDVVNYALQNYRVDVNRVYLSGLSLGGGAVVNYAGASTNYGNRVAAIVPFSAATAVSDNHARVTNIANANVPIWFFDVTGDKPYDSLAQNYIDSLDTHKPSPYSAQDLITLYASGGHDSWVQALQYPATTNNTTYPNVYDWMLTQHRSLSQPQFATVSAGSDQAITLSNGSMLLSSGGISFTGATVTLNGSASSGGPSISTIQWIKVDGNGSTITNPNSLTTTVTNLKPGSYTYQLRVTDNQGLTTVSNVKITVNAPTENKYVKVESEAYTNSNPANSQYTIENSYYDQGPATGLGYINPGYWVEYSISSLPAGTYALYYRYTSQYGSPQIQIISGSTTVTHTIPSTGTVPSSGPWSSDSIHIDLAANPTIRFLFPSTDPSMEVHLNYFELAQLSVDAPLPVKFEYFNAQCRSGVVSLQWKTAQEMNSDHFSVQRSSDGSSWTEIGTLAAAGQSNQSRSYVFVDKTPSSSILYRIVEHDNDGRVSISSIVRSVCTLREEVSVYPNPSLGNSALNITLNQSAKVSVQIIDSKGSLMQQTQILLPQGSNTIPLNMSNYPDGVYNITVQYNQQRQTIKLIKK